MPAKGLGWPDQPMAWTPDSAGLHQGHAEPEGPELSDGPRAEADRVGEVGGGGSSSEGAGSSGAGSAASPGAVGLGWPQNFFDVGPLVSAHGPGSADQDPASKIGRAHV